MGIAGFGSKYSCLWCHCANTERFDMSKTWSMTDPDKGARSTEEIIKCSKKKLSDKTKYNCKEAPLCESVQVHRVVPDTLHLYLRIGDQLVSHLISYLQTQDNVAKVNSTTKLQKCENLKRFHTFVRDEVKISDWKLYVKDNKLEYRSFRGPEHRTRLFRSHRQCVIKFNRSARAVSLLQWML